MKNNSVRNKQPLFVNKELDQNKTNSDFGYHPIYLKIKLNILKFFGHLKCRFANNEDTS